MIFFLLTIIPLNYLLCTALIRPLKRGWLEYIIFGILFVIGSVWVVLSIDILLLLNVFSLVLLAKRLYKKQHTGLALKEVSFKCVLPTIIIYTLFWGWLNG